MSAEYRPADVVAEIAADLIPEHHPDLLLVQVRYVFRSEHARSKGKAVFGRARKITGLNAFLAKGLDVDETWSGGAGDEFFVIEIAEDLWVQLDDNQQRALVDHELCHCVVDEDENGQIVLKMRAHDLEEFTEIVQRHGLWFPDVTRFARAVVASQGALEFPDDADEAAP